MLKNNLDDVKDKISVEKMFALWNKRPKKETRTESKIGVLNTTILKTFKQ